MNVYFNPHKASEYPQEVRSIVSRDLVTQPQSMLRACPKYEETALVDLPAIAQRIGVASVQLKDETARLGLGSFKALGGTFAVASLVKEHVEEKLGRPVAVRDLTASDVKAQASDLTVACASAGNHGLAVAAGARLFGCRCVVYLAETVPDDFRIRLREKGAEVVCVGSNYEQSMEAARKACKDNAWLLVSDAAWPGNERIPALVMQGYLVMAEEAAEQCERDRGVPTHIFLQAGVGGMAASVAGYFHDRYGARAPFIAIVEPEGAPCLLESVRQGKIQAVEGGPTLLGRLDCKEASSIAYRVLCASANAFVTIADEEAFEAVRCLYQAGLRVGESGAAGLGALLCFGGNSALIAKNRRDFAIDRHSRVLLIASEGPADAALFARLTEPSTLPH